ncbi:MAG: tetratricopeptide repeat protein [Treponema sp.]|nr:tetratricopeptide repeat protein [Treponema sp.]
MIFSVLIAVIVLALVVVVLMAAMGAKKKSDGGTNQKIQRKGKAAVMKDAQKKLAHNPKDIGALEIVGDIYYGEKNWEKTWNVYKTLYELSSAHLEIDVAKVTLRMGIAAFYLEKMEDAASSLVTSLKRNPENFECNFYLGKTLFNAGNLDKAFICLKKAKALMPENPDINEVLGQCLFKSGKYKESLPFLKKAIEEKPDNKELLFDMAVSMTECGFGDKALKVFMHLRPDPQFGAQSCLEAGKMHERTKDYNSAIKDYEIAIKLQNVPEQIDLQIKYRYALTCIAINDISKGLTLLRQIQSVKQGYKDVDALIARYSELNQNKNLQTYLMSGTSDFVALCRKFISTYHKDGFVKVEDVQVTTDCVEIICNVENPKWEARQIFRFYRTQNVIGDLNIREFHSKVRDSKCDTGYCISMGNFSESAHKYIDGRPVDLIEKDELVKTLKKINMFG